MAASKLDLNDPKTIEKIRMFAENGLTQQQIYEFFKISKSSWYEKLKNHPDILDIIKSARSAKISYVASKLDEQIEAGNIAAIIFYLKTQAGWSDKQKIEIETAQTPTETNYTLQTSDPIEAARIYQKIMEGDK